jgi:hypothetical protein
VTDCLGGVSIIFLHYLCRHGTTLRVSVVAPTTLSVVPTIFYTTDGSTPTINSPNSMLSGETFTISTVGYVTVRALAAAYSDDGGNNPLQQQRRIYSRISSKRYRLQQQAVKPVLSPNGGTFAGTVHVKFSSDTTGALIHYSINTPLPENLNAAAPGEGIFTLQNGELALLEYRAQTVYAVATAAGYMNSDVVVSNRFNILPKAEMPIILPSVSYFTVSATLFVSTATPDAHVFYTLDGSEPSEASLELTDPLGMIVITGFGSHTIKAFATEPSMLSSDVVSKVIMIFPRSPQPVFQPAEGRYVGDQQVFVSCGPEDTIGTLFYTLDGSTPSTNTLTSACGSSITLKAPGTYALRAYLVIQDMAASSVSQATYQLIRPDHDIFPMGTAGGYSVNPLVSVHQVETVVQTTASGNDYNRVIRGRLVKLANPIGHVTLLEPASGCSVDRSGNRRPSHETVSAPQKRQLRDLYHDHDTAEDTPQQSVSRFFSDDNNTLDWRWDLTGVNWDTAVKSGIAQLEQFRTRNNWQIISILFGDSLPSVEQQRKWLEEYQKTTADDSRQCVVVANAGYVNLTDGKCFGNIVSNERVIQERSGLHNTHFGIRNGSFFLGYLADNDLTAAGAAPFDLLFTGSAWLVRHGVNYALSSISLYGDMEDATVMTASQEGANDIIARSAIGYDRNGQLLLLQIEGNSLYNDGFTPDGVTLNELADISVTLGFEGAANIAGGELQSLISEGVTVSADTRDCTAAESAVGGYDDDDAGLNELYRCAMPVSTVLCVHSMPPPLFVNSPALFTRTELPSSSPTDGPTGLAGIADPTYAPTLEPSTARTTPPTPSPSQRPTYIWEHVDDTIFNVRPTGQPTEPAVDPDNLLLCTNTTEMMAAKQNAVIYQSASVALFILLVISLLFHLRMCLFRSGGEVDPYQPQASYFKNLPQDTVIDFENHPGSQATLEMTSNIGDPSAMFNLKATTAQPRTVPALNAGGGKSRPGLIGSDKDWRERLKSFTLNDSDSDEKVNVVEDHGSSHQQTKVHKKDKDKRRNSKHGHSSSNRHDDNEACSIEISSSTKPSNSSNNAKSNVVYAPIRGNDDSSGEDVNPFKRG